MTPIEIIALIFSLIILIKIGCLTVAPKKWMKFAEKITKNVEALTIGYLAFALVLGYFVFQAFSVIDVAAMLLFTSAIMGLSMTPYIKDLFKVVKKQVNTKLWQKYWLILLIWLFLALWVLKSLFL